MSTFDSHNLSHSHKNFCSAFPMRSMHPHSHRILALHSARLIGTAVAVLCLCAFSSCSLTYNSDDGAQASAVPEMIISAPRFSRIENGTKTLAVTADSFELFKDPSALYASDVAFTVYEKSGDRSANGSGALLCALTDKGEYTLLGGASFESGTQGVTLAADTLRFNNKTEQLTTPVGAAVTVTRTLDDGSLFTATGKGFTASAFDLSFRFADSCSGTFTATQTAAKGATHTKRAGNTEEQ